MLQSQFFLPLLKEKPNDAHVASHALMLRSGMIRQQAAGIYSWLPLGLRVLKNIENIVRFNMDAAGCLEMLMPCIQPAELWIESGRLESYGKEMLKFKDRHENSLIFGPTNEDMITALFRDNIHSYKDLPKNFYHIQWKFRDEIRPRFGVMRGREFLMKDAYSFDINAKEATRTYQLMFSAYMATFRDLGLLAIPVLADTGPIGGNLSHEFHVIAETGESTIYYDKKFELLKEDIASNIELLKNMYAAAEEKHNPAKCSVKPEDLLASKAIEVGHIFYIGTKYSTSMNAYVTDSLGQRIPVEMSSYGIGISRLVAAIIESSHDEKGIIWPKSVAPFKVSLLNLNTKDTKCRDIANYIYEYLKQANIEVLYDDTDQRPGSKFAAHDLIGSPWQVIVGPKKAAEDIVELKHRATGETEDLKAKTVIEQLIKSLK